MLRHNDGLGPPGARCQLAIHCHCRQGPLSSALPCSTTRTTPSSRGPFIDPTALLAAIPAIAFGACLLPLLLQRLGRRAAALAATTVMVSCLACVLPLAPAAFSGSTQLARLSWLPAYGLDLSLRLDGLGLLFCLLILGIGLLVVLYAAW